ncbi:MAG TPA: hypothetical protein VF705_10885, partial [Longimicrobium sp.]
MLPKDGVGWHPAPGAFPGSKNPPGFAGPEQTAVTVALQLVQLCMGTPYGMLLAKVKDSPISTYGDYTMWTSVRDHTNRKYYFASAFSGLLTKIDLTEIDFAATTPYPDSPNLPVMPQPDAAWCVDATSRLTQVSAG